MKFVLIIVVLLGLVANPAHARKANKAANVVVPVEPETRQLSGSEMAVAGAAATVFGVVVMHPVDTIKTLQQSSAGAGLNMVEAGSKIFKEGGLPAIYSGLGPYVTSDGFAGALKFATYERLKTFISDKIPEEHQGSAIFVAAALAFLASSTVLVPGELLKQRLQMGQISSVRQGVAKIFKEEGILGFYAGYSGVCIRDVPYTMLELGVYDNFKTLWMKFKNKSESNQWDELLAAAIAGGVTGFLTAPLDNIKTKLMVETGYNGFFDCLAKTVKTGGMPALFAGSAARVAWLLPFTAIYLPVYEIIKRKMSIVPSQIAAPALALKGGYVANNNPVFGRRPAPVTKSMKMKNQRLAGATCF